MLCNFDIKYFREIINGWGDIRKNSIVNIITWEILMLQKKVMKKRWEIG